MKNRRCPPSVSSSLCTPGAGYTVCIPVKTESICANIVVAMLWKQKLVPFDMWNNEAHLVCSYKTCL